MGQGDEYRSFAVTVSRRLRSTGTTESRNLVPVAAERQRKIHHQGVRSMTVPSRRATPAPRQWSGGQEVRPE